MSKYENNIELNVPTPSQISLSEPVTKSYILSICVWKIGHIFLIGNSSNIQNILGPKLRISKLFDTTKSLLFLLSLKGKNLIIKNIVHLFFWMDELNIFIKIWFNNLLQCSIINMIHDFQEKLTKFKNTLDRGAFFLFPLLFLLFNSVYWTLYLTVMLWDKNEAH